MKNIVGQIAVLILILTVNPTEVEVVPIVLVQLLKAIDQIISRHSPDFYKLC